MGNVKSPHEDAAALQRILIKLEQERVAILGVPAAGKSTLQQLLPGTLDMDELLFPKLTTEEKKFVFQEPWIPEVGIEMKRLAQKWITIHPGAPVFATVLLEADYIIYLAISDAELRKRIESRKLRKPHFELCKGVQEQLADDILESKIPYTTYSLG